MNQSDELLYEIAFAGYRNINLGTARHFGELGISPVDFFVKPATTLAAQCGVKASFFDDSKRNEALEFARRELDFVSSSKVRAIYYTSEEYPQRLAECDDAPAMLYLAGDVTAASLPRCIAIVGTRHSTSYGADFTRRLVADLAQAVDNILVISGLAYGIDIVAHRAALDNGVATAAILAHGLNTIYPADHRQDARKIIASGGFVASEYRTSDHIHRGNFLARNRLVAALSDVTVVVESDLKGGAMTTARFAGEYNREVMAVPGRINDTYSRGCNELIASNRASIIRDAGDLIRAMQWTVKPKSGDQSELKFEIPPQCAAVLNQLAKRPEATINDLCVALDMPFAQLSALLFEMEIDDYIIALPGGRYTLPSK